MVTRLPLVSVVRRFLRFANFGLPLPVACLSNLSLPSLCHWVQLSDISNSPRKEHGAARMEVDISPQERLVREVIFPLPLLKMCSKDQTPALPYCVPHKLKIHSDDTIWFDISPYVMSATS